MQNYILKAGNRRPLKFTGVLLAATWHDLEFSTENLGYDQSIADSIQVGLLPSLANRITALAKDKLPHRQLTMLTLFKTQGGSVVYFEERIDFESNIPVEDASCSYRVFPSIANCVKSLSRDDGSFGILTAKLLNLAIDDNPTDLELSEAWVQSID